MLTLLLLLPLAADALSRVQAEAALQEFWSVECERIRVSHADAWKAKKLVRGKLEMPFDYKVFGEKPASGRSLFLSLHGGGNTAARVNDQQWRNQLRLYQPAEGVYCCPRAPTNTWNLWHEPHIDLFCDELIRCFIVFEGVDPNRVYVMGYSAGGDGVFQLAPRMADRWAAAAMMAGHPGDASPLSLRNLPFALHMGEKDDAYGRSKVPAQWKEMLEGLQRADPGGYIHEVKSHAGKGHWMDRQDAVAVPWMASFARNPFPKRIVWKQDDVTHDRFYWLAVPPGEAKAGALVEARLSGQAIEIETKDVKHLLVRLNDQMIDLDQPVTIKANGKTVHSGKLNRIRATIETTLKEHGDPKSAFCAEAEVAVEPSAKN